MKLPIYLKFSAIFFICFFLYNAIFRVLLEIGFGLGEMDKLSSTQKLTFNVVTVIGHVMLFPGHIAQWFGMNPTESNLSLVSSIVYGVLIASAFCFLSRNKLA